MKSCCVPVGHGQLSLMHPSDEHLIETAHAFGIYNHGCTIEHDPGDGFVTFDILQREGR